MIISGHHHHHHHHQHHQQLRQHRSVRQRAGKGSSSSFEWRLVRGDEEAAKLYDDLSTSEEGSASTLASPPARTRKQANWAKLVIGARNQYQQPQRWHCIPIVIGAIIMLSCIVISARNQSRSVRSTSHDEADAMRLASAHQPASDEFSARLAVETKVGRQRAADDDDDNNNNNGENSLGAHKSFERRQQQLVAAVAKLDDNHRSVARPVEQEDSSGDRHHETVAPSRSKSTTARQRRRRRNSNGQDDDDDNEPLPEEGATTVTATAVQFDDEAAGEEPLDEDDEREEDDEDFYSRNPLNVKSHLVNFDDDDDDDDAVKVSNADFRDTVGAQLGRTPLANVTRRPSTSTNGSSTSRASSIWRPNKALNSSTRATNADRNVADASSAIGLANGNRPVAAANTGPAPVLCALSLASGRCLTYAMLEWAAQRARMMLRFRRPADLNSPEPSESTINAIGELNELTTRLLAARLQLTWDEITFELERVDLRGTSLWASCPALFRAPGSSMAQQRVVTGGSGCNPLSRYRTHTGHCNNLFGPHLGSANMPFVRLLPPSYADGIGQPRRSVTGAELAPARLLALSLHPGLESLSSDYSALFMAWGQLINHDLASASGARDATGHGHSCCRGRGGDQQQRRRELQGPMGRICMPIEVGPDDPLYARYGVRCHEFKRSLAGLRPGCSLGPRTQLNTITSFIDASFVYGSSRSTTASLRSSSSSRGLLQMRNYFADQGLKALLPAQLDEPDDECIGRRGGRYCFRSGDSRTNQHVQLVALHTLHSRQHNRLARALSQLNPHWTDNRIYHEARHIHVALVQHILLAEYLPALLGSRLCDQYNLTEAPEGVYWDHYEPAANPGISQAFAAAAFRQGHSTVPTHVFRFTNQHEPRRVYLLRQLFRQPWPLYEPGAMDEFLLGMLDVPSSQLDPFVSPELSGHLLAVPGEPFGLDLAAINIQRGRDQGLAGYNEFRDWCGLGRVSSFEELEGVMSAQSWQTMGQLYASVDDIDLFSAGISEFPLEGAQVGPTFACIIGRQFQAIRAADRFWFESSAGPQAFTLAQLASIKQVTLARLVCANSDSVLTLQASAFHLTHPILNPRLPCPALPDLDLSLWLDPVGRPGQNTVTVDDNDE